MLKDIKMSFSKNIKEKALVKSRRCCCLCHEFAGVYSNVHHIKPKSKKGADNIENAIVLCLRCHGEVGHYNPDHPIGNKYTRQELIKHRDLWWEWCEKNPAASLPNSPIIITPHEISLFGEEWETVSQINIYNKTDTTLYQVWIKVVIKSGTVSPKNIELSIVKYAQEYTGEKLYIKGVEINPSIMRMTGIDRAKKENLFLIIDTIKPQKNCEINIRVDNQGKDSEKDKLSIFVASFSTKPNIKRIKKDGSRADISFTPPEPMTPGSWGYVLKGVKQNL